MKSYLSGVGYKAMLGLALAGWLSALQGDGWKLLLTPSSTHEQEITQPPQEITVDRRLSVDGVHLGDDEATVRGLWGEPLQVESDLCADFAAPTDEGYRYLRYENSRMVVLRNGRVVVVDGGSVGLNGQEFNRVHAPEQSLRKQARTQVLSYRVNESSNLHYTLDEGKVRLVSLSISRES